MIKRGIGLGFAFKSAAQCFEFRSRLIGGVIGQLWWIALFGFQFQRLLLSRRIVAGKPDIADLADRAASRNSFKAACPKDRRFERELWRQSHAHLFAARRLSGLVIENHKRAIVAPFTPGG